ncbi:hypothetical protein SAMN04488067_10446 [Halorubrum xinjiangense]|uniref:Uncharacterized protein n=1 Tax=Halorubrum xinjiangense TaxID=261291 RepID=A0A1G7KQH4_9EURY|nr:hypothetical protein [Halorubrum xinjiangense]SDF39346.1 hypothetical protein SAMN04488067_10446 [Halorubrum xinjiangense]
MDGRETAATRRGTLRQPSGVGAVGAAVIWVADATRYVDDRSVRADPR